jgi:hypothetical protein
MWHSSVFKRHGDAHRIEQLEQEARAATARIQGSDSQLFLATLYENAQTVSDIANFFLPEPDHVSTNGITDPRILQEKRNT